MCYTFAKKVKEGFFGETRLCDNNKFWGVM